MVFGDYFAATERKIPAKYSSFTIPLQLQVAVCQALTAISITRWCDKDV